MAKIIHPVYILIRTSGRPIFFKRMMESVKSQTYQNIVTIVHSDDSKDKYVEGDIVIRNTRSTASGRGYFNLYCNYLLEAIPRPGGWYHFIDDDDMYAAPDVIERFVSAAKKNYINVARVERWNGVVWPKTWRGQKSFQTECFLLHTKHRKLATWHSKKAGDHNYTKKITKILPINWIENLLVCRAQEGKGRGLRLDKGQPLPPKRKK